MVLFDAYRWNNIVFIDEKHKYHSGEILCDYLNLNINKVADWYKFFQEMQINLLVPHTSGSDIPYDRYIHDTQKVMKQVDRFLTHLKPYDSMKRKRENVLYDLLNGYPRLFSNAIFSDEEFVFLPRGNQPDEEDLEYEELVELYDNKIAQGIIRADAVYEQHYERLTNFDLCEYDKVLEADINALNNAIGELWFKYSEFCVDVLRVQYVFADFLDNYFHMHNSFPTAQQAAEAYEKFIDNHGRPGSYVPSPAVMKPLKRVSSTYDVLSFTEGRKKTSILCEVSRYGDIGSFLTDELFSGMGTGCLPKRCSCCGKYFLLTSGYYHDFCDHIAPGETEKTCRDIGARKKFDEKVKSDPIWLTYQRAYKAHYARVMKKKMSKPEFSDWVDMAIALRGNALAGEVAFEEYAAVLKK